MVKLSPFLWNDLVKQLRKHDVEEPYQEGKHPYMIKKSLVSLCRALSGLKYL